MISLEHKKHLRNIEKRTGMFIQEIQKTSAEDLRKRFKKNPFEGLDPFDYKDAKKILRKYETMKKKNVGNYEFAREVIDADLTVYYFGRLQFS